METHCFVIVCVLASGELTALLEVCVSIWIRVCVCVCANESHELRC